MIQDYLTNRTQKTIIGNTKSNSTNITHGVPQGSILGPLFFNLSINDITQISKFSIKLFADDACLIYSADDPKDLESTVNNELIKINTWRKVNKFSINFTKSNYMIFSKRKNNYNFTINMGGNVLKKVNEANYLGITLHDTLKWNKHINNITNKICRASYILTKIRHYTNLNTLKMLYNSLVQPNLTYCLTAWGGAPKSTLKPLTILQKRILRIMTKNPYDYPSTPLFSQLHILPLTKLYNLNSSILMYKIDNNMITGNYNLIKINKLHNYSTRFSNNLNYHQPFYKTNQGISTFSVQGIKFWNQIPSENKKLPLHMFKKQLKQYLINSLNEAIT